MNDLDFSSLRPNVVEGIKVYDPVTRAVEEFILNEPSAGDGTEFRTRLQQAYKNDEDGNLIHLGNADAEAMLVARCLRHADGRPVSETKVKGWPDRVLRALYAKVEEISDIGQPMTEEQVVKAIKRLQKRLDKLRASSNGQAPKNSPEATTASSD